MTKTTPTLLTLAQTDELILSSCRPEDGAIEDCEMSQSEVSYFFETGAVATVDRITGMITVDSDPFGQ